MLSRQQYLRYVAQQPSAAPAPRPARKLTAAQRVLAGLVWALLVPFLLIGFLLVGELPRLKG
jgi:hypothetical protein